MCSREGWERIHDCWRWKGRGQEERSDRTGREQNCTELRVAIVPCRLRGGYLYREEKNTKTEFRETDLKVVGLRRDGSHSFPIALPSLTYFPISNKMCISRNPGDLYIPSYVCGKGGQGEKPSVNKRRERQSARRRREGGESKGIQRRERFVKACR